MRVLTHRWTLSRRLFRLVHTQARARCEVNGSFHWRICFSSLSPEVFVCHLWLTHRGSPTWLKKWVLWNFHHDATSAQQGDRPHAGDRNDFFLWFPASTWSHSRSKSQSQRRNHWKHGLSATSAVFGPVCARLWGLGIVDGSLSSEVAQADMQTRSAFCFTGTQTAHRHWCGSFPTNTEETEEMRRPV